MQCSYRHASVQIRIIWTCITVRAVGREVLSGECMYEDEGQDETGRDKVSSAEGIRCRLVVSRVSGGRCGYW